MATVSKYGLAQDDETSQGGANVSASNPNQGTGPPPNPFATQAANVKPLGAAAVIPEAQQFAFNDKYAAQSQALDRLLANKGQERENSLVALDQNWQQQRGEAETTRAKALDQLIGKYGNSGMLWSSIDAGSRADLQNNFTKYLGQLDINRAAGQQDIHRGYGNLISDINAQKAGMWGQQVEDQRQAEIKAADDRRAADAAQRQADENRRNAEIGAQAARDAAAASAANRQPAYTPAYPGGGGGGGEGLGITDMSGAGIGPQDTMQDLQGQINLLFQQGQTHQLALIYNSPYFQSPNMAGMKKAIGGMISQMSTPGNPYYSPARPGDSNPGGFY